MYIIKRNVSSLTYFWNDTHERWEGLEDNATVLDYDRVEALMNGFGKLWGSEDYYYTSLGETIGVA